MCDQEHMHTFYSQECKITMKDLGKLVAREIRTPNNVYILYEINGEKCFMGKKNEIWLWHKRMGHVNFENMVKINTKQSSKRYSKNHKTFKHYL
jgi:hypothetical protein